MSVVESHSELDFLVTKTKTALELWLTQPNCKALQQEFKDANQELLEFSRSQRELSH